MILKVVKSPCSQTWASSSRYWTLPRVLIVRCRTSIALETKRASGKCVGKIELGGKDVMLMLATLIVACCSRSVVVSSIDHVRIDSHLLSQGGNSLHPALIERQASRPEMQSSR